jgi:hypothetical protein
LTSGDRSLPSWFREYLSQCCEELVIVHFSLPLDVEPENQELRAQLIESYKDWSAYIVTAGLGILTRLFIKAMKNKGFKYSIRAWSLLLLVRSLRAARRFAFAKLLMFSAFLG